MANMDEVAGETAVSPGPHSLTVSKMADGTHTHRDTEELPNSILSMIYRNIIDTCKMFAY